MTKVARFLLFIILLPSMVACGGGTSGGSSTGSKTVINFFGWGSDEEQANFQQLINTFMEENPDIKVVYEATASGDVYDRTLKSKKSNLPDVFYVPDYSFFEWVDSGKLLNLSNYVSTEEINSIWAESTKMYRYNPDKYKLGEGDLFGLPKDLGPYSLVFNVDMLSEAIVAAAKDGKFISYPSFDTPMTTDAFVDYCNSLHPYLVNKGNPKGYVVSSYELMDAVWSNNADFFTEDTKTSRITEKNFTDAVQWIADLSLVHQIMPTPKEQEALNGYQRFLNKGCLFTFMGPWDQKAYWEGVDFKYDIMPTPVGTADGSVSTSWVGSVAYSIKGDLAKQDSVKCEAAVRLAKWLTFSETSNKMNVTLGQAMPNLVSKAKNEFVNNAWVSGRKALPEHKQVWIDMTETKQNIKNKHRAKYYLYQGTCFDDLLTSLYDVYAGTKTAVKWAQDYNQTFQNGLNESQPE